MKKVSGVDLTLHADGSVWIYRNTINNASFMVDKDGDVNYSDPFGNCMTNSACHIRINFEAFRLEKMGDEIRKSDGSRIIMMPKEQIQEIANKTFYADGQFHAIDFLTYTITEENNLS